MNHFVGDPSRPLSRGPFLGARRSLARTRRTVAAAATKGLIAKAPRPRRADDRAPGIGRTRERLWALRAQERHRRRLVHAGRVDRHRARPRREALRGSGTTRRGPEGSPLGRRYPSDARRMRTLDVCRWRAAGRGADADADIRRTLGGCGRDPDADGAQTRTVHIPADADADTPRMRTRHRRRHPADADAERTRTRSGRRHSTDEDARQARTQGRRRRGTDADAAQTQTRSGRRHSTDANTPKRRHSADADVVRTRTTRGRRHCADADFVSASFLTCGDRSVPLTSRSVTSCLGVDVPRSSSAARSVRRCIAMARLGPRSGRTPRRRRRRRATTPSPASSGRRLQ
jgi:hypothetical protein